MTEIRIETTTTTITRNTTITNYPKTTITSNATITKHVGKNHQKAIFWR